jgi:cell division protein FtsW (lipid II flippase)
MKKAIDEKIRKYLDMLVGEMTFREAHEGTRLEILNHIEEQIETGMSYGLSKEDATQDSLLKMGDPVKIGKSLNQIHRPRFDFILPLLGMVLSAVGLWNLSDTKWIGLQVAWISIGLIIMTALYFLPIRQFKNVIASLYGVAILALIASHFSGVTYDGQTYLSVAGLNIKIVDLSGCLFALGFSALGSYVRPSRWSTLWLLGLFLVPMFYFSLSGFIWPGLLLLTSGLCYLGMQKISNVSFIGAGVSGTGMLMSRFSESLVPMSEVNRLIVENAHTDYAIRTMSTAVAVEIFSGAMFIVIMLYGIRSALAIKDLSVRSMAVAGMCLVTVQIITSILANVGVFPMIAAGVNVPFISYGGSGIVSSFLIIGAVVACYKRKNISFLTQN